MNVAPNSHSISAGMLLALGVGLLHGFTARAQVEDDDADSMTAPMTMDMGTMLGGRPPADARDPHAYSDGEVFGPTRLELADTHRFGYLLIDNLEVQRIDGNSTAPFDIEGWYGGAYNRGVVKAEGEIDNDDIAEGRTELLWGHAFAPYWDRQLGIRHDSGEGPDRNWVAFGVEGLAPYWFDMEATFYLGESSRTALRFDASYELLLTQKLILQPRFETNVYGKRDPERGLGSGLSDISAALRLRYEFRRELAPYIGIEWVKEYGETEDFTRAIGGDPNDVRLVAGLRFWF